MSLRAISSIIFILSIVLLLRIYGYSSAQKDYKIGDEVTIGLTMLSDPTHTAWSQQFSLKLPTGEYVFVSSDTSPKLAYGDVIEVRGKLSELELGTSDGQVRENQILALDQPQIIVKKDERNPILAELASLRYEFAAIFRQTLPQVPASLLLGIVFGIKDNMPSSFKELLQTTGVTHVIAASGMNITLIAGFLSLVFGSFLKRKHALILTLIVIALYTFISGLQPSIIRAAIMGGIAFGAQIYGRQNVSVFALILTAFLMLFVSPVLIIDIGFQLSFVSTLGIILLGPVFMSKKLKLGAVKFFQEDFATTVSAQIASLPIILSSFGSYFLLSIIVNILILWTIPFIMILGGLGALISLVFRPLGVLLVYISYPLLIYFQWVVKTFGQLDLKLDVGQIPWQLSIGYYLLLLSLIVRIKR